MSEGSDYNPGSWAGHDFNSARAHYDHHAGRGYDAAPPGATAASVVPNQITTETTHPSLIMCDVTGSMSGWPNTIFSKLPYLDHELRTEYLAEDAEVSFAAISDTGDTYPFQVQPFTKGTGMKDALTNLVVTNGGTGPDDYCEAYNIAALYASRNIHMPRAVIKPVLILIGDEKPYTSVTVSEASTYAKVSLDNTLNRKSLFDELMEKYSVYLIQKPYHSSDFNGGSISGVSRDIHDHWCQIIGGDRIALLPAAERVVDVIFGIFAHETGRTDYFRQEIEHRQNAGQVKTVYTALHTIHAVPQNAGSTGAPLKKSTLLLPSRGKSTLHRPTGGKKGNDLD